MGDFNVHQEVDAQTGVKTENVDTQTWPHAYTKHRRSKSASDRHLGIGYGVAHSIKKNPNETNVAQTLTKSTGRHNPTYHDNRGYVRKNSLSNHRASLEKDIEQLQLRLQQEKSMRIMLEKAMGRASSSLSPGHRHFAAQAKELISEIELLEEEVANRELHVLALYRSIFEHSVSRPASAHNSGKASPIHYKNGRRKHPSIISNAFCSSTKFHFQPLQALVSMKDSGIGICRLSHFPVSNVKSNACLKKNPSSPTKVHENKVEKTAVLRTLKDHLHQCPCKLSEEMVRCMAAVYCRLWRQNSSNAQKHRSSSLSRSFINTSHSQPEVGKNQEWKCKVEISRIASNKSQFSQASYAIYNYRSLVEQLERVNVTQLEHDAQIAFWINVYNALMMHAYLAYGIPRGSLRRLALFHKAAYNIGGHIISANAIEQDIFCLRTPRIGRWIENIVSAALRKKSVEEKQVISSKFGLRSSQPLVCFALCTGALSDPVLRVYSASGIKEELDVAKREFLQANVIVKKSKKVFLPKLLERYARETSTSLEDILKWIADTVDKKQHDSMQKFLDRKSSKRTSQMIEWLPYSSKLRYVFSEDLTDKPWWA